MDSVPGRRFYLALYIVGHWYHTRILYDDRDVLAIWMYRRFFSWLSDHGWGAGFNVGMIGGLVIYGICCITRIVNPEIRVDFFDDGTTEWHSERANGIVGLLVLIGTIIFVILKW